MKLYVWALAGVALLAGCGQGQAPIAPSSTAAAEAPDIPVMGREVRVLAFGDSLFAGYGLNADESYPARLESALRARGVNARVVNAGVSGNTTADGLARLKFTLDSQKQAVDLALVEFGGNDVLRALPPQQARENLDAMLAEFKRRGIRVVLMGMLAPPNLGPDYRRQFDAIYPELAAKHGATLVPFFLAETIGRPDRLQDDRIHPNVQGVEATVAKTVDAVADVLPVAAASGAVSPPPG